jgi:hypothetical protein
VPQLVGDLQSLDPKPVGEDNDEEPLDNDDKAFGLAISTEDESDVLQGVLGLCDQDCKEEYNESMNRKTEHFFY